MLLTSVWAATIAPELCLQGLIDRGSLLSVLAGSESRGWRILTISE